VTTRTRCLATVAICASALGALLTASGAATAAAKTPSINGIWLAYSWFTGPASKTPNQVFVLRNNPGSTRVTGEWQGEFTIVGTFSPTTGEATLVAGVQPGVTQTTDFHVDFKFKSASTAPTNHPTFSGWFDYVTRATGLPKPGSKGRSEATRCSYSTGKNAVSLSRL
jgi:hypothetical protein